MRKDRLICTVCLGALAMGALELPMGARPAVVPMAPAVAAAMDGKVALEERKSDFEVTEQMTKRNPFWPVGWLPGMKAKVKVETQKFNPTEAFSITSILLGPPDLAVINGKRYETGQVIPTLLGTQKLQIKIIKIQDGGVIMALGKQQFLVPKKQRNPDSAH